MILRRLLIFCILSIHTNFYAQQSGIQIQHTATNNKVEIGTPMLIVYHLTNMNDRDIDRTIKIEPFITINGPQIEQSSQFSSYNGRTTASRTNSYTFQLIYKKLGKFNVPKMAFILVDGSKVEAQTFQIEVVKQGTLPKPPPRQQQIDPVIAAMMGYDPLGGSPYGGGQNQGSPSSQQTDPSKINLKNEIFARIHVNKNKVYVGEPITASIKIYTSLNSKGFEAEKLPNFNGFWSQDIPMPPKLVMNREQINGKEYVSVEIKKILLFPTRAGTLEITPLKMKTIAIVPVAARARSRQPQSLIDAILQSMSGMGGGMEYKEILHSFSSGSEKITVLPLPAGAPASFSGGVGRFSFSSFTDNKELKTDEALNQKLEITGSGNLPLIEVPKNEWSEDFEIYDPQLKESFSPSTTLSGTKAWNYVIIPHQPGSFSSPKLTFTYFDLDVKKYVTIEAPATPIKITGNPTKAKEKGTKNEQFNFAKQKIKEPNLKDYNPSFSLNNGLVYWLGLIPLILGFIAGYIPKYEKRHERFSSGKKISEQVTRQMKQAELYLKAGDKKAFYQETTDAYWDYLGHKLKMEISELTRSNIADKLKNHKVEIETISRLINIIDRSEMGLYTTGGSQEMNALFEDSLVILNDVEKQFV